MSDFTGRCLCGAVTFAGRWTDDPLRACHCGQCRRWSGHVWAAASARGVTVDGPVRWYRSSDQAERGFCPECGSSLFWRQIGAANPEIAAGAVDSPTGLRLAGHIYVADKGDYYDIADGLPQEAQG
ncbi:Glutathione-dependent formaldehyde-activating enzyme [Paracoccus haematequi]|uniref:Glutathione-dependent formaldehyde-activating enzyme n=1 Tax=Paracoccus haematequi TaxID=2491866 RepID=A0A3S4CFP1_9RHOB|nr:GFA family protein [Paracoccus haematequi]VDS06915.1 Glutathione-dependent formaldehyde-activating enzyme [Paracoccus haematequi]